MLFHGGRGVQRRQRVVKLLQVAVAVASVVQVMTQAGYKQTFPLRECRNTETGEDNMRWYVKTFFCGGRWGKVGEFRGCTDLQFSEDSRGFLKNDVHAVGHRHRMLPVVVWNPSVILSH